MVWCPELSRLCPYMTLLPDRRPKRLAGAHRNNPLSWCCCSACSKVQSCLTFTVVTCRRNARILSQQQCSRRSSRGQFTIVITTTTPTTCPVQRCLSKHVLHHRGSLMHLQDRFHCRQDCSCHGRIFRLQSNTRCIVLQADHRHC